MSNCKDCGKSWGGKRECHCVACHETFSTEANFRQHQGAIVGCFDPRTDTTRSGELRFKQKPSGVWVENSSRPVLEATPTPLVED